MRRGLDGIYLPFWPACSFQASPGLRSRRFSVVIARGKHLFPFRTEPLSPSAPMVLGGQPPGRVGRRRFFITKAAHWAAFAFWGTFAPRSDASAARKSCLRRVALERGAEVRTRGPRAREAPLAVVARCRRPGRGLARCPTGAAGGPRRRLPSGPAIGSGMPVGPLASGPLRAG